MPDIRMPTQKRSIEKRNRIIKMGFELMCNKGYYNTTIPDIAEYAEVSVGIIYQYFNDKKDVFIEGVKNYSNDILYPMFNVLVQQKFSIESLNIILEDMIDKFIQNHTISKKAHEELIAMSHLDDDIANIFKNAEFETTEKIVNIFKENNITIKNSREKVHIAYNMIDNFCHEVVYHKHSKIDYSIMKREIIDSIMYMLKK